jgi:hypothetical protein
MGMVVYHGTNDPTAAYEITQDAIEGELKSLFTSPSKSTAKTYGRFIVRLIVEGEIPKVRMINKRGNLQLKEINGLEIYFKNFNKVIVKQAILVS